MVAMNAHTRKRQRREARRAAAAEARSIYKDEVLGIRIERLRPGGGKDRLRVVWDVDADPFLALIGLDRLRRNVLHNLEESLVVECRVSGLSWDEIGDAFEQSGEAVRKRQPEADGLAEQVIAQARAQVAAEERSA